MSYNLYIWITTPIIIAVWLYLGITGFRKYFHLLKTNGLSPFSLKEMMDVLRKKADPVVVKEVEKWRKTTRRLFLIWVITVFGFLIISAIISNTIGFK